MNIYPLLALILLFGCVTPYDNAIIVEVNVTSNLPELNSAEIPPIDEIEELNEIAKNFNFTNKTKVSKKNTFENKTTIMQTLLANAPSTYWYWNSQTKTGAIVQGPNRREIIPNKNIEDRALWQLGDLRWNTKTNEQLQYTTTVPKSRVKEYINATTDNIKIYVKENSALTTKPKGPKEWMQEFENVKPTTTLNTTTTITSPLSLKKMNSNLQLVYNQTYPQQDVTIYIHNEYSIPIRITIQTKDRTTDTTYEFALDTKSGPFKKFKIDNSLFELENNELLLDEKNKDILSSTLI